MEVKDIKEQLKGRQETEQGIRVLSLFSGCGGMDLGFEGGFMVHRASVNERMNPDFIEREEKNGFVRLRSTAFRLVFANDILKEARTAWTHNFAKYEYEIPDDKAELLELTSAESLISLNIVTIPNNMPEKSTINLLAPVIINAANKKGMQLILQGSDFSVRQPLFTPENGKEGV